MRSVKSTALPHYPLQTPVQCATFLTVLSGKLLVDLSDPSTMMRQEAYYRFRLARRSEIAATVTPLKSKPRGEKPTQELKAAPFKPCSGHLGFQLSAVRKDGRSYTCAHRKDCTYRHVTVSGKLDQKDRIYATYNLSRLEESNRESQVTTGYVDGAVHR